MKTVITTKMVRELRARHRAGEKLGAIALDMGIHPNTAYKYGSDLTLERCRAEERKAWRECKKDPVRYELKKARSRKWYKENVSALRARDNDER